MLKLQRLNISSSAVWELIRKSVLDARESWTSAHHGLRKCLQMQVKAESYKEAAMCEHDAETPLSSLGQSSFQIHKWPGLFIAEGSRCWTGLNRPFTNQQHSAHHKTKKLQSSIRQEQDTFLLQRSSSCSPQSPDVCQLFLSRFCHQIFKILKYWFLF